MPNIIPPPALQGDEQAQLQQVYRYLFRLSEQLNMALTETQNRVDYIRTGGGGGLVSEDKHIADLDKQYASLKSLIIKTADVVRSEIDKIEYKLDYNFVAESVWGVYEETITKSVEETAKQTVESYNYEERISGVESQADGLEADFKDYKIATEDYFRKGYLYVDDENYPIFGIAIGRTLKEKEITLNDGSKHHVFDTTNNMATYTADRLSFWVNGVELAYMGMDETAGELVITRAVISKSIQLGDWLIKVDGDGDMSVKKSIASELSGDITLTAKQINAVADEIDLSGNTSITLTAQQVNAVADDINLKANKSILLMVQGINENIATVGETAKIANTDASSASTKASEAVEALGDIPNYIEVDKYGLVLKDQYNASTLRINSASVSIGTVAGSAADGFSQFAGNYVQFGDQQIRRTNDGGLVFRTARRR